MSIKPTPKIGYFAQLAIFLGSTGVMIFVASLVILLLAASLLHIPILKMDGLQTALKNPANASVLRWINTIGTFFMLCLPTVLLAAIVSYKPLKFLGFNTNFTGKQVFIVILLSIACLMLSASLGAVNEIIPMPAKFLAKARQMEKEYSDSVTIMATMKTNFEYFMAILAIAFFPALFEELFFRAGLQKLLVNWTENKWLGIILTSIIFSAIHFSYFGFLARAGLGVVLGLIFYYTKNIWLNFLLHFLNNAIAVTMFYTLNNMGKSINDIDKMTSGTSNPLITILFFLPISLFTVYVLLNHLNKESKTIIPAVVDEHYKLDTYHEFMQPNNFDDTSKL